MEPVFQFYLKIWNKLVDIDRSGHYDMFRIHPNTQPLSSLLRTRGKRPEDHPMYSVAHRAVLDYLDRRVKANNPLRKKSYNRLSSVKTSEGLVIKKGLDFFIQSLRDIQKIDLEKDTPFDVALLFDKDGVSLKVEDPHKNEGFFCRLTNNSLKNGKLNNILTEFNKNIRYVFLGHSDTHNEYKNAFIRKVRAMSAEGAILFKEICNWDSPLLRIYSTHTRRLSCKRSSPELVPLTKSDICVEQILELGYAKMGGPNFS